MYIKVHTFLLVGVVSSKLTTLATRRPKWRLVAVLAMSTFCVRTAQAQAARPQTLMVVNDSVVFISSKARPINKFQLRSINASIDASLDGDGMPVRLFIGDSVFSKTRFTFHPNGNMAFIQQYTILQNNVQQNGCGYVFYDSGELRSVSHRKDGKLEGAFIDYNKNGSINGIYYYKNNMIVKKSKSKNSPK